MGFLLVVVLLADEIARQSSRNNPEHSSPIRPQKGGRVDPGRIEVDRVWQDAGYLYALVSYQNHTRNTFTRVTIECIAKAEDGSKLGVNSRSWFEHRDGPIPPGFTGVKEVPVNLHGADGRSMSCKVTGKR